MSHIQSSRANEQVEHRFTTSLDLIAETSPVSAHNVDSAHGFRLLSVPTERDLSDEEYDEEIGTTGMKGPSRNKTPPFMGLISRDTPLKLQHETEETLSAMIRANIANLCQERGLRSEGDKKELVKNLMDWTAKLVPVQPHPDYPAVSVQRKPINTVYLSSLLMDDNFRSEISYDQLKIGRKLGSGGFKDCYAGTYNGENVAIGELRVQDFTQMDTSEIKHEINILKRLRHECIVSFVGVCTNVRCVFIVTELCENGDLYSYMRKARKPTFIRLITYMHDIAKACSYLHSLRPRIIHRDMKSLNLLITSDNLAKAPEFWTPNPIYTEKVDVYACGLVFWEILSWAELG
ncbi:hypothetical protein BGZ96_007594 [Linnemannia gamsii]|uniref:Kinase-like protein n=1 Tax=Linnemannia gamsii TaxID=64522 RepID=A0ABQ7K0F9_9FUNG|nr:hypothetical protein BGZ96_007594 [Linnemannia gamsii]